jgi:hypothetical protein
MKLNMGSVDRVIRVVAAILLIVLGLTGVLSGTLAIVGYVLGAVLLLTSAVGFCPLYSLFNIRTSKA